MSASTEGKLYVWVEVEPNGREGVIATATPRIGVMALQHRRLDLARALKPFAEAHRDRTNLTVRLVEFVRTQTIEELS
jgi:hypothetical protein